ncbi:GNAT family protein [uncultured Thiothrix sp.]|uniref:GNAT family N-acetyltransferase n=1 Tax=uncultured Thiothrix sp. TaxID=223185 RepID=UPI00260BF5DF|nr:GNAT family protein [uncultured Thiothrix sp.]
MQPNNDAQHYNELGQAIGFPVAWQAKPVPSFPILTGQYCRLEPLSLQHAQDLFAAFTADQEHRIWTYLPYGPFTDFTSFSAWLEKNTSSKDPVFYSILNAEGKALGMASYLRIDPANGVIEVGHINFSPALQKTRAATETMYLMMHYAFEDLGYRRYEWKCDALNKPSRQAAERLGFQFEGIFRQATVYKHRNRDTAWYSILDSEWPALKQKFDAWLEPSNFDTNGRQINKLVAG